MKARECSYTTHYVPSDGGGVYNDAASVCISVLYPPLTVENLVDAHDALNRAFNAARRKLWDAEDAMEEEDAA